MSGLESRDNSADLLDPLADARLMTTALDRAGCPRFDVTLTNSASEKVGFFGNISTAQLRAKLPALLGRAERASLNIIVRPRPAGVSIVQLDDIDEPMSYRLAAHACCITETSPNNFQAFVALAGPIPDSELEHVRHRLIAAAKADKMASGAGRIAGSLNVKEKHRRPDGTFPRVRLASVKHNYWATVEDLEADELLANLPLTPSNPKQDMSATTMPSLSGVLRPRKRRLRRAPSYDRCVDSVRRKEDGEIDRSAVDYLFAVTCLDWGFSPEQTADLLRRHSPKAAERSDDYTSRTVFRAQREVSNNAR